MGQYDDAKAGQSDVFECYAMESHNFESMSVKDLRALVESGNPSDITSVGHALLDAHGEITDIANQLKHYVAVAGGQWQGAGATAFQDWGNQFANQSLKLAHVAYVAGDHMSAAGYALGHAQSVVRTLSPDAKPNSSDHNEAITQVSKVASTYVTAKEVIQGEQMPNFQPLPESTYNPGENSAGFRHYGSSDASSGTSEGRPAASYVEPVSEVPSSSGSAPHGPEAVAHDVRTAPSETNVDSHTSLDSAAPTHVTQSPAYHEPVSANGTSTNQPSSMRLPPVFGNPGFTVGTVASRPASGFGRGLGNVGGLSDSRLPAASKLPTEPSDGIVGGIPSRNGSATSAPRIPRGTVIGGGEEPAPRGSVFRGPIGEAAGASGFGGPGAAAGPGRRLASEPGGVVGEVRSSGSATREFTPGGSGLVREGQEPGARMVPSAGVGSIGDRRRPTADRPDYLEEDEETWNTNRQDVVPRVID
ncbi:WXG100 family type VII secretion target [Streptomyces sp. RPT161]|uniref:WXG100 family type VII secretion target n=1 Tax=Streptomyces sp. RPT161 TaxID=3015993 RepID=UPI0022B8C9AF|nr:WXG100 family type VII secretion target [Streptomyces sp. RPT161]